MTLSSVGKFVALTLLSAYPAVAQSSSILSFAPATLTVGSGPIDLVIHVSAFASGVVVRWNGEDRTTSVAQSGTTGVLSVKLSAADMAAPGLGEVTIYDPQVKSVVADSYIGIGYNVVPLGVVYDSARKRFYIVTPPDSKDPHFPANSVVALDPETGSTGPVYTATNYLGQAALSSDGSLLYVAGDGDSLVRSLDAQTLALRSAFDFRGPTGKAPPYGFGYPTAIAAMPGQSGTVAVSYAMIFGDPTIRLAIFDNGEKRSNEGLPTGPGLLFSPDGKYVFTQGNLPSGNGKGVLRLAVEGNGIPTQPGVAGTAGIPTALVKGVLYTSAGTLLDSTSLAPIGDLGVGGSIAVDAVNQRILTVSPGNPELLQAFDLDSLGLLGALPVPGIDAAIAISFYSFPPYRQLITFGSDGVLYQSTNALVLFHSRLAAPAPRTSAASVVNSASNAASAIAPGELITIYGSNLGPAQAVSAALGAFAIPESLSGVQVLFDKKPGHILLAGQGQINVIAPFGLQPGSTTHLQVWYLGLPSASVALTVVPAAPGIFTRDGSGKGLAAVINQDGSVNAPSTPGNYVTLFGTGGGFIPGAADGELAPAAATLSNSIQVSIDGQNAPVSYAGAAPTLPNGVFQINALVPATVRSGTNVPISVIIGSQTGVQTVTLAIW